MDDKDNPHSEHYDSSWDVDFDEDNDFDEDDEEKADAVEAAFHRKMAQWEKRNWQKWLKQNLTFPFTAIRENDDDDSFGFEEDEHNPFAAGSKLTVLDFGYDDFHEAVLAQVRQGRREGWVPLADLKVTPKTDPNYWAVREYVMWFANR